MKPRLGWVWLSQAEREGAEAALDAMAAEGARDELGFGHIHFAYADRFFPGTSVLQTRLRYLFFIAWAYRDALDGHRGTVFPQDALNRAEDRAGLKLIGRYGRGDNTGIIGIRILSNDGSPQTKPSRIYWNALRTWGLLAAHPGLGAAPSQAIVRRDWGPYSQPTLSPEVDGGERRLVLFENLPPPPREWGGDTPLPFDLSKAEADRVRAGWEKAAGGDSLMSRLAQTRAVAPDGLRAKSLLGLCTPDERRSLALADGAASLVCIGRAVYGALVEDQKAVDRPGAGRSAEAGSMLKRVLHHHRVRASALDVDRLAQDTACPDALRQFLIVLRDWCGREASHSALRTVFRNREVELKDAPRALLDVGNVDRRMDWNLRAPSPLTYRWDRVSTFLNELAAQP